MQLRAQYNVGTETFCQFLFSFSIANKENCSFLLNKYRDFVFVMVSIGICFGSK
jgi:hypothetical protein